MSAETSRRLSYTFRWPDGREKRFDVSLGMPEMSLKLPERADYPAWTALEVQKCPGCPLDPAKSPRCPAAVSLIDVVETFKGSLSTEVAQITIGSERRDFSHTVSVSSGVSSLMGLLMATSGCPVTEKLRPMVFTHLPFANAGETMYRALSMYLVAQFLRQKKGLSADWNVEKLAELYRELSALNRAFAARLASGVKEDASLNAIAKLDCFAGFAIATLERGYVQQLETLFASHLRGG